MVYDLAPAIDSSPEKRDTWIPICQPPNLKTKTEKIMETWFVLEP